MAAANGQNNAPQQFVRALRRERIFRDRFDPLQNYDGFELYQRFRFDREGILFINDIVKDYIAPATGRNHSLPSFLQVLLALRFYATGKMQLCSGDNFNVDQSTVSRVIQRVTNALNRQEVVTKFISFPISAEAVRKHQADFYAVARFPGVIGAIDGTHIRILRPSINEPEFVNRKNFHSINVQIVVDANSRILDLVARWPGSAHDARILRESGLARIFEARMVPVKCHLLGDSGYPCKNWLLTPYLNPLPGQQTRYNSAHKTTRCIVERAIGQWKRRFHVLHGEIRLRPERVCKLITACGILHNIAKLLNMPQLDNDDDDEDGDDGNCDGDANSIQEDPVDGRAYRTHIVCNHF
ncbi:putative nuclease HARBI1 [Argopecten irradians]|uniref:putative nuclease HARBI1 n=1 Tax=Argopecten irradians TaxID=31199 RepID=UPI003721A7BE